MKKIFALFTLFLAVVVVRAALPQPDLIAQIHFAGARKIATDKNFSAFTNEFACPEFASLAGHAADRLAAWFAGWIQSKTGVSTPGASAKLRPLFDDLQASDWFLEARSAADGKVEVAIAIKLDGARAQLWQANLRTILPMASFAVSNGYLIVESGTAALKLGDAVTARIAAPTTGWASADVNWPRLGKWYPELREFGLPETQFNVAAPDDYLRVTGRFYFPENLSINLDPWRVPTNTLHQPFISLTALRGFAGWLKSQDWAADYKVTPAPNQIFTWALPGVPYQSFAALPFPNAVDALQQVYLRLKPKFDVEAQKFSPLMPFELVQQTNEIVLHGVPFAAPFIRAVKEPSGNQFLLAGAFPNSPRSKPLPPELFQRLAQDNLVLYHWEITAERWPLLLNISQLGMLLSNRQQLPDHSPSMLWCQKAAPRLGNTITEVFKTGPAEMSFSRKGMGVFTAAEMFVLGQWLENPAFPHCNLQLPPPRKLPKRTNPQIINIPAQAK